MNRLTMTFLVLLTAATLSAGALYQNASVLIAGHGGGWNWIGVAVSVPVLGFLLLILGRILYLTAPQHAHEEVSQ